MSRYFSDSESDSDSSSSSDSYSESDSSSDSDSDDILLVDATPKSVLDHRRHHPVVVRTGNRRQVPRRRIIPSSSTPSVTQRHQTTHEVHHISKDGEDMIGTDETHITRTTRAPQGTLKQHRHKKTAMRHKIRYNSIDSSIHHHDDILTAEKRDDVFYPGGASANTRKKGSAPIRKKPVTARYDPYTTVEKRGETIALFTDPFSDAVNTSNTLSREEREYLNKQNASIYDSTVSGTVVKPLKRIIQRGAGDLFYTTDVLLETGKDAVDGILDSLGTGNIQHTFDDTYNMVHDATLGNVEKLFDPREPLEEMDIAKYGNSRLACAHGAAKLFDKKKLNDNSQKSGVSSKDMRAAEKSLRKMMINEK